MYLAPTGTEPGPQFNATECTSNAETQHNHVVYCHHHYITVRLYKNSYLWFNDGTCRFQSSTVFKTWVIGLRLPMNKLSQWRGEDSVAEKRRFITEVIQQRRVAGKQWADESPAFGVQESSRAQESRNQEQERTVNVDPNTANTARIWQGRQRDRIWYSPR